MSPEALVQALARDCGVERRHVRVEVTYPADFFLTFASAEICDRVFSSFDRICCAGAPIGFQRWHRSTQAVGGKLGFFCKLGIEGLPASAWEVGAVSQLINNLQGQLVEILPQQDRWQLEVTAWLRNPSGVPKIYDLEVPEPVGLQNTVDEEWLVAPPPPALPTERLTLIHPLTLHVLDVVDRTVPYLQLRPDFQPDEDEDLTRRHDYSGICYRGRIDGEGRGDTPRSGGHPFGGPGGLGIAGDWGGRRSNGVFGSAGGISPPFVVHPASHGSTPAGASPFSDDNSDFRPGSRRRESPLHGSVAPTAVGSAAYVDTPVLVLSAADTAVGPAALVSTPAVGKILLQHPPVPAAPFLQPSGGDAGFQGA